MTRWINAYQTACEGATIEYSPSGSAPAAPTSSTTRSPSPGSDSAMEGDELKQAAARCNAAADQHPDGWWRDRSDLQPWGCGQPGPDPDVTAKIFNNRITSWNDRRSPRPTPAPRCPMLPSHSSTRSDGSEPRTTSPSGWRPPRPMPGRTGRVRTGLPRAVRVPRVPDGSPRAVKSTPNSIGYVELSVRRDPGPVRPHLSTTVVGLWPQRRDGHHLRLASAKARTPTPARVT